jgi:hypothetical protein
LPSPFAHSLTLFAELTVFQVLRDLAQVSGLDFPVMPTNGMEINIIIKYYNDDFRLLKW